MFLSLFPYFALELVCALSFIYPLLLVLCRCLVTAGLLMCLLLALQCMPVSLKSCFVEVENEASLTCLLMLAHEASFACIVCHKANTNSSACLCIACSVIAYSLKHINICLRKSTKMHYYSIFYSCSERSVCNVHMCHCFSTTVVDKKDIFCIPGQPRLLKNSLALCHYRQLASDFNSLPQCLHCISWDISRMYHMETIYINQLVRKHLQ